MRFTFVLLAATMLLGAQDRDFLTSDEADQVREAQEPNARLKLYLAFAQQRVELIKQLLATEKPGRTMLIHDTLEDYTHIIEAIDTVADDALKRRLDITLGMKAVADGEKHLVTELQKLTEKKAKDFSRYEFAMQQAIETTSDSADLSNEDMNQRAGQVAEREHHEKAERDAMTSKKEVQEQKAADKKTEGPKRKVPTLRRPGEKINPPQ
jgi:uncharacterized protein YdiU (UPF0061 family)